jgi:hypothetical protein
MVTTIIKLKRSVRVWNVIQPEWSHYRKGKFGHKGRYQEREENVETQV